MLCVLSWQCLQIGGLHLRVGSGPMPRVWTQGTAGQTSILGSPKSAGTAGAH